ncbi:lysophospholipid acyltransferase family protein [Stenotrophomonas tumulicola]
MATEAVAGRLDAAWRVLATGLSFAVFGVGGLLFGAIVAPSLLLGVRDPARRRRLARGLVQRSFALHVRMMRGLGVLTFDVRHGERLQRDGLLVLANHPTLIDVVFLVSLLPHADCVIKRAVARNPFMQGTVRAAGYIVNDDGPALVEAGIEALQAGGALVVFPEGTRSTSGQPLRLRRGAANIAVRGRRDITPVRIRCTPPTLEKGQKWYRVPPRRFHVSLEVGEDIPISTFFDNVDAAGGEALAARRVTEHLTRYFQPCGEPPRAGT